MKNSNVKTILGKKISKKSENNSIVYEVGFYWLLEHTDAVDKTYLYMD